MFKEIEEKPMPISLLRIGLFIQQLHFTAFQPFPTSYFILFYFILFYFFCCLFLFFFHSRFYKRVYGSCVKHGKNKIRSSEYYEIIRNNTEYGGIWRRRRRQVFCREPISCKKRVTFQNMSCLAFAQ